MKSTEQIRRFASTSAAAHRGKLSQVGALLLSLSAVAGCADPPAPDVVTAPKNFDASSLEGAWYIVATDLPMWTSGEKTSPMLHYTLQEADGDGKLELEDKVTFLEDGKPGEYVGKDTQDPVTATNFTRKDSGALSVGSSNWYIVYMSPEKTWAVNYYDKTSASPAGVGVLSRTPTISDAVLAEARTLINGQAALQQHAEGLKVIDHSATPNAANLESSRRDSALASGE